MLNNIFNPNQHGLFWRLSSCSSPPSDLAIAAKICIKVECDVNCKTVSLDYSLLSFILYELIMLSYANKKNKNKKSPQIIN